MADLKEILRALGNELRKSQSAFFSRKLDEIPASLKTLESLLADAQAQEPDNVQVRTFGNQIAKLKRDLEQRTGAPAPPAPPSPGPTTPPRPVVAAAAAPPPPTRDAPSLPAGVAKRLRDMKQAIDRKKHADAISTFREIDSQYGGQFDIDHPEYAGMKAWVEQALAGIEGGKAAAQAEQERLDRERTTREAASNEWEERLKALKPFGNRTGEIEGLLEQETAFAEARSLFASLREVAFPFGKTYGLEQVEKDLEGSIQTFPAFLAEAREAFLQEALGHLEQRAAGLEQVLEGKPSFMSPKSVAETERFLERFLPLFPAGGPENARLTALRDRVLSRNEVNKKERATKIFIRDDVYQGEDAARIREQIETLALESNAGSRIVTTRVTSSEWKEVSQWEDYAGTPRFVIRGEIYGQSIVRIDDVARLVTVYVTRVKSSDGTWSRLTGNVMGIEEIASENIP